MLDQKSDHEYCIGFIAEAQNDTSATVFECCDCFNSVEKTLILICRYCGGNLTERELRPNDDCESDITHSHRITGGSESTHLTYDNKFA